MCRIDYCDEDGKWLKEPHKVTARPPALIEFDPRGQKWADEPDPLWLLTSEQMEWVPEGQTLVCIDGSTVVKGRDYIDDDTRFGCLAFGFRENQLPRSNGRRTDALGPEGNA